MDILATLSTPEGAWGFGYPINTKMGLSKWFIHENLHGFINIGYFWESNVPYIVMTGFLPKESWGLLWFEDNIS